MVGSGMSANVYPFCCDSDCKYVGKVEHDIFYTGTKIIKQKYMDEINYQNRAAELKVSIPIIDTYQNPVKNYGVIIMPALKITIANYIKLLDMNKTHINKLLDSIVKCFMVLISNSIKHDDEHLSNVMISQNDEIVVIDFGSAIRINDSDRTLAFQNYIRRLSHEIGELLPNMGFDKYLLRKYHDTIITKNLSLSKPIRIKIKV